MQIIIFPTDENRVAVLSPAPGMDIAEIAAKDVPTGKPWRIIDESELPARETRDRWLWTESGPLDVGPEIPVIPDSVSRFQARAALLQAGLLAQAEAAVAQSGPLALLAWQDAQEFRRNSPTINSLASAIGLTPEQIDALFIAAAQIEA